MNDRDLSTKRKWEVDLEENIDVEEWSQFCSNVHYTSYNWKHKLVPLMLVIAIKGNSVILNLLLQIKYCSQLESHFLSNTVSVKGGDIKLQYIPLLQNESWT